MQFSVGAGVEVAVTCIVGRESHGPSLSQCERTIAAAGGRPRTVRNAIGHRDDTGRRVECADGPFDLGDGGDESGK